MLDREASSSLYLSFISVHDMLNNTLAHEEAMPTFRDRAEQELKQYIKEPSAANDESISLYGGEK